MREERKKLSDILRGTERDALSRRWRETEAAADLEPLPPGEYLLRILSGDLFASRGGTPGYKLTLEVAEGEYEGRRVWHDIWVTEAAMAITRRDLEKLGFSSLDQLERPLPAGILVRARVTVRKSDNGTEYNRVARFTVAGIEPGDAFEPSPQADAGENNESEPFPFGENAPSRNGSPLGPYDMGERR